MADRIRTRTSPIIMVSTDEELDSLFSLVSLVNAKTLYSADTCCSSEPTQAEETLHKPQSEEDPLPPSEIMSAAGRSEAIPEMTDDSTNDPKPQPKPNPPDPFYGK